MKNSIKLDTKDGTRLPYEIGRVRLSSERRSRHSMLNEQTAERYTTGLIVFLISSINNNGNASYSNSYTALLDVY